MAHNTSINLSLAFAIQENQLGMVKNLVEHGGADKAWGLNEAVRKGRFDIVRFLVEKEQHVVSITADALVDAIVNHRLEVVEYLTGKNVTFVEGKFNADKLDMEKVDMVDMALEWAARENHLRIVKCIVDSGAADLMHSRALAIAAKNGYLEMVEYLVENGAPIGNIVLYQAIRFRHTKVAKYFIGRRKYVNKNDLLERAVLYRAWDVVRYLVEMGADVHVDDDYPLRVAAASGQREMVDFLLARGAQIDARDNLAIRMARAKGQNTMVDYLEGLSSKNNSVV